jgi:hypothetical protein
MDELLVCLRGLRNGAVYGTRIRAPHAFGVCHTRAVRCYRAC